jgi:hypothetical protein
MNMKVVLAVIIAVLIAVIAMWAIDVDVSGDVELPEITADMDVDAEGGEMPKVDVNTVDVDVREERGSVPVPTDIDVETEEQEFTYPTIDIQEPEENDVAEETDFGTTDVEERPEP